MVFLVSVVLAAVLIIHEYKNYGGVVPIRALNRKTRITNLILIFIQRFSTLSVVSYIAEFLDNIVVTVLLVPICLYCFIALFPIILLFFGHIINYLDKPKKPYK